MNIFNRPGNAFICGLVFLCSCGSAGKPLPAAEPVLYVPDGLEAVVWAESPMFYNPTNIDVDIKGRIWVTEAVNYRDFRNDSTTHLFHPEGDRVMILEDRNGDGVADSSKVFVQDKDLRSPLGIAVIGNRVIVSCSPSVIVYTDIDGDDKPDKKEVFLTGFGGRDHDHGLHSGIAGPDGRLYFNAGNAGPHIVTDKSGFTLRAGSVYTGGTPDNKSNTPAMRSDDGRIWSGGLVFRINPDGTGLEVMSNNFRNSYEVFTDSFGDLWQNDNDDEKASCRTSYVMEGGNAGYFARTGERTWQADQRPGQPIEIAHWHQEDPGVTPSGDIYGSGSPTGVVVNEGDAMGSSYRGLLLSADAGRNIVFGYTPQVEGAGFKLDKRMNFISSVENDNKEYRWSNVDEDKRKWFRPSDVAIGTDGAIYVADWYDPIVGGHQMKDEKGYGRIYRITPKGKKLSAPVFDLSTVDGQVKILLSDAIIVRNQGFERLKAQGEKSLPAVKAVLSDENPYHRARAVWLLARLGSNGIHEVETLLDDKDERIRITAFRALQQSNGGSLLSYAQKLAKDPSAAVRRAVAISLKNTPLAECQSILLQLVSGFDGKDRYYLNALGIGLNGKAEAFYPGMLAQFNEKDPANWSAPLANLAWELHPDAAVRDLQLRASAKSLSMAERERAMVALAFIPTNEAALAVRQLALNDNKEIDDIAQYWLQFRKTNDWKPFLQDWKSTASQMPSPQPELLKDREIIANDELPVKLRIVAAQHLAKSQDGRLHLVYLAVKNLLPDTINQLVKEQMLKEDDRYVKSLIVHYFKPSDSLSFTFGETQHLSTNVARGKSLVLNNCQFCHKVGSNGGQTGPVLTNIQGKYDKSGILTAVLHPDEGIAFGSETYLVTLKNGAIIYGILLSNGPVVTVLDVYGRRFMLEDNLILNKQALKNSLMPSPKLLQLKPQDIADITSYLLQPNKATE